MDSRAKQRLTGAIILVAIFVALVPELLKGPRVADAPGEVAADEGMRRYTIDLDASAPPAQAEISPAPPPLALPAITDDRAKPGEEAAPANPEPVQAEPAAAAPAAPRVETPKPAVMPTVPRQATPAPAPAPVPAPAAAPAARGAFVVQIGTFSSRDNADGLVRKMTAKGFTAFVAPFSKEGRELYRVRVGPASDRTAAEALAAQLRRMGQPGSIVQIS